MPETPEQRWERWERWKHTSFLGHAAMMRMQCSSIMQAKTTTHRSCYLAQQISELATELAESLKERR